ncbi:MucB/RseB C-terminal domain-containing protein [Paenalcaligenes niemegkensis]|uniref:MucB/RseB C-terminal domain-containing protein n=1 Tax=Paenalcaligenes niemegkensis TaxID=2895469 RepID=UPI001EE8BA43|nr:MucB/RseB C-terminal domain-containing protein [Paenalcaligenes niemegkensis]MCQ9616882.1 MucB/RseB C-terminal domain-containing protein [Paenalcaligenes niemegkensis]
MIVDVWPRKRSVARVSLKIIPLGLFGFFACLAFAHSVIALPLSPSQADDPLHFLAEMQSSARELDYAGVITYTQGSATQSMRLVHMIDGTGERERLELLDGKPREFLRNNEQVQCLVPERKVVILERKRSDRFPAVLLGHPKQLLDYYSVSKLDDVKRVAGRECTVYELNPKDELRYGYRLCADTDNALLLQAQTLNANGDVIQQVSFVSIAYGSQVKAADLQSTIDFSNWRTIEANMNKVDLSAQGWRIEYPAGFEVISQVARSMGTGRKVSQLVLSDGLAAISVFIEPVEDQGARLKEDKGSRRGSMNLFRTRIGDYWLTTTGEVPLSTLTELGRTAEFVPLARKN